MKDVVALFIVDIKVARFTKGHFAKRVFDILRSIAARLLRIFYYGRRNFSGFAKLCFSLINQFGSKGGNVLLDQLAFVIGGYKQCHQYRQH